MYLIIKRLKSFSNKIYQNIIKDKNNLFMFCHEEKITWEWSKIILPKVNDDKLTYQF